MKARVVLIARRKAILPLLQVSWKKSSEDTLQQAQTQSIRAASFGT